MRSVTIQIGLLVILLTALSGCSDNSGVANESWADQKVRFQQVAENAKPLIVAIKGYVAENGKPPIRIEDITPKYIKDIPATGLKEHPEFTYRAFLNRPSTLVWYDLGSRQGKPVKKPAKFPDGDPENAILVLLLNTDGKVVSASIDRLPKDLKGVDFSVAKWKMNENRMLMSLKLSDAFSLKGMPRSVFQEMLGYPDGERNLENVAWELRIDYSTGLLNRDVFFYWPIQKYPPQIYSGDVELVADWAYVHD